MKVIFCRWNSICEIGIANALKKLGCDLVTLDRPFEDVDYDKKYLNALADLIQDNLDTTCVLTINFWPIVARVCKVFKMPYFSWTVDCPSTPLYSDTIAYSTNRIFQFDRMQYEKFSPVNPECFFHLPLACDIESWENVTITAQDHKDYDCDISFIGSLYSEKCMYNSIEKDLPDYMQGYVDGLIHAQFNVYGYNFLEDSITDEWAEEFKKYADWFPLGEDYTEDVRSIVADTYIGHKCTEQDRLRTLSAISKQFDMDLWTLSDASMLPDIHNRGGADSITMMPKIIKCSKINLNMTDRPIKTGLPLRIFDIMGAGGFLISNYQAEIPEHFIPDEDIVLYDSIPDLLDKIDYYLTHDEERIQIAKNGHEKVKRYHTYEIKLLQMFKMGGVI